MIQRLREIAGHDAVTDGEFAPFRVHGRAPAVVVSPWNADQAAAVLRVCSENHWLVEPAGAGTWLDWGRPPERVDVLLTAERLAGIVDYEPADLTISVGAGTPLAEIAETVTADRQMLGLDPPARPGATIGATAALASGGPLRFSVGTARDQVLGLELVTGDGRVVRLGGRVVKNVAGYDLVRLAVGSRGTLGFLTRLDLRLRPSPDRETTALFSADTARPLLDLALGPAKLVWPAAIELLGPRTAAAVGQTAGWTLAIRCRGNDAFVAEARRRLASLAPPLRPEMPDDVDAARFWEGLANLEARATLALRFASLPNRLARLSEIALETVGSTAAGLLESRSDNTLRDWHLAAHAGDGVLRLWRDQPLPEADAAGVGAGIGRAREELASVGGTVTAPMAPGSHPGFDLFGHPGPVLDLMRGLKSVFDPAGVLSRGRFTV